MNLQYISLMPDVCMGFVVAELGDFMEEEYHDPSYLMKLKLLPGQNEEILHKVMEHHREHM